METEELENWNQLEYCKYSFWEEGIYIDSKEIHVRVNLEIDCDDWETPNITINTRIIINNYGHVRFGENQKTELANLFKVENLSIRYFYLLSLENKMIQIALKFAEKKIEEITKTQGQNL